MRSCQTFERTRGSQHYLDLRETALVVAHTPLRCASEFNERVPPPNYFFHAGLFGFGFGFVTVSFLFVLVQDELLILPLSNLSISVLTVTYIYIFLFFKFACVLTSIISI